MAYILIDAMFEWSVSVGAKLALNNAIRALGSAVTAFNNPILALTVIKTDTLLHCITQHYHD